MSPAEFVLVLQEIQLAAGAAGANEKSLFFQFL